MGAPTGHAYVVYGVVVPTVRRTVTRAAKPGGKVGKSQPLAEEVEFFLGDTQLSDDQHEELTEPWDVKDRRLFQTSDASEDVFGVLIARATDDGYGGGKGPVTVPVVGNDVLTLFNQLVTDLGVSALGYPQLLLIAKV